MGRFCFFFLVFSWKIQILGDLAGSEGVPLLTVPFQAISQLENSLMRRGNLNLILLLDSYLQHLCQQQSREGEGRGFSQVVPQAGTRQFAFLSYCLRLPSDPGTTAIELSLSCYKALEMVPKPQIKTCAEAIQPAGSIPELESCFPPSPLPCSARSFFCPFSEIKCTYPTKSKV